MSASSNQHDLLMAAMRFEAWIVDAVKGKPQKVRIQVDAPKTGEKLARLLGDLSSAAARVRSDIVDSISTGPSESP